MSQAPFSKMPVNEGAEAFVALLNANGVDCVFISPGSDTISIQEAIAKFKSLSKPAPRGITCLDESVGMAAAHGYFMVSGRPQVVLVHADLGTLQIGGALHNAQRDRVGIVVCAGRAPLALDGDRRYGRKSPPQWMIEKYDQAGIVRDYVKWYYELRSNENIHLVVQRAFQMASTEPCGPVYLILPPELLLEKIDSVLIPDVSRYGASVTPQADENTLAKAADMLMQASNPLIITGYSGRNPGAVAPLVELAETLSARVATFPCRASFPTTHLLWGGISSSQYVSDADVILVVDHDVPYIPARVSLKPGAKIIHIDIDPVKKDLPTCVFPADILIEADSSKAIPALNNIIRHELTSQRKARYRKRYRHIEWENGQLRSGWRQSALSKEKQKPISAEWLCRCIDEVLDEQAILLSEVPTATDIIAQQIRRTEPGTAFDRMGSSLGWGLGAAVGAKLAAPDKQVVLLVGDGSFVYGCPTASLWASAVYGAPFLCVIFCDGQYSGVKREFRRRYGADCVSEKTGLWVGAEIIPAPDYALIAQACGVHGSRIEDPAEIRPALEKALEQVRGGRTVVLDVRTAPNL